VSEWWHDKALADLSPQEWDALCDGCGRCCLHKLEDSDTGEISYTRVHCRLLEPQTCRCTRYENRAALVPDCVQLKADMAEALAWLPPSCAYRLRAELKTLPSWHYLVSGSRDSVHQAGISMRGQSISEEHVHPDGYDEYILTWVSA